MRQAMKSRDHPPAYPDSCRGREPGWGDVTVGHRIRGNEESFPVEGRDRPEATRESEAHLDRCVCHTGGSAEIGKAVRNARSPRSAAATPPSVHQGLEMQPELYRAAQPECDLLPFHVELRRQPRVDRDGIARSAPGR